MADGNNIDMQPEINGTLTATYRRSQQIELLFTALAKAQASFTHAEKAGDNPHFHSRYATLETVLDATKKGRAENSLAVIQMPVNLPDTIGVTTLLGHSSGQWIESTIAVPPGRFDAQGAGSVITYLRRYALMAVLGIAGQDEDDDGEAAVDHDAPAPKPLRLQTDKTCPNCRKTGTLFHKKATGLWECWKSKGGCESTFTDAQLAGKADSLKNPEQRTPTPEDESQEPPEDSFEREQKRLVNEKELEPLLELIAQATDPEVTKNAILTRCNVKKLGELTSLQVTWQIGDLQKKLAAREANKRPRK